MKQKNIYIITLSLFLLLTTLNLISSEEENKDINLEIIDNNITFYRDNILGRGLNPVMNPDGSLFEGERMEFRVKVYSPKGIKEIENVYVTAQENIEVYCRKQEIINNFNQIWYCSLVAETPESMYGFLDINLVAESLSGKKVSKYIGTYFFNPRVIVYANPVSFTFPNVSSGEKIYTDFINIENKADEGSNVSLTIFVSAPETNNQNKCIGKKLPLNSLYYYAENGEYSTKNDPRADKEGYIQITSQEEIDHNLLTTPLILDHSNINEGNSMKIRFRINVPSNCNGSYSENIYLWSKFRGGGGGFFSMININLNTSLDQIPPKANIRFNSNIFEVNGFDEQGNTTTTNKIICLNKNNGVCSKELRRYVVKDESGNDLSLNVIYEKVGNQVKITISNLKYNGGKEDYEKVEKNEFWLYTFPNFSEKIIQTLKIGDKYITTSYNPTTNKTKIEIKNKTGSISYIKDGYYNIELTTNKGGLRYEIKPQQIASVEPVIYEKLKINDQVRVYVRMKNQEGLLIDDILNNLDESEFKLSYKSLYNFGFFGNITKAGLNKVEYNSNVRSINLVRSFPLS